MKKNLKKVISAVLALTLAMSSFVAMTTSAATFADVADTASYAEAVNALAALGAISGTGDGTFKPDDNITRAEAATMVVAALNLSADAQNAGSTSKFTDVNEQAKWAVGYVNVGVAQNYISGTSATTFNPLDNVTYAQMLTMLTRILGYGDFAVSRGGYPDGYVTSAAIAGIVKGVAAGNEEAITRAQAAQLIWNAVQAPMLDIVTFTGSISDTELKKMDGKDGRDWKTVLSDKFDAYVLDVTVEATSKSAGLEAGTIEMKRTNTNQWDPDSYFGAGYYDEVAVGATDAEDYLFSSAKVVAEYNDDEEWKLIYFAPTSKVATKTIDGTLINAQADTKQGVQIVTDAPATSDDPAYCEVKLHIKKSEGANAKNADDYKLVNADLYVNGFYYCDINTTNAATVQALIAASTGDTVLVQKAGETGKVYDKVMIDVYALAQVTQVKVASDKTTVKVTRPVLPAGVADPDNSIVVTNDQVEDGDKVVTVTKAGAASSLSALAIDDIIAVKYDLSGTFDAAKYIDIIASNDTASGVYTSKDPDTNVYTVGGVNYKASNTISMDRGATYTLYLDPFGEVFAVDQVATSINYAIVEAYTTAAYAGTDFDYIDVVTLDGQSKRLYVEQKNADAISDELLVMLGETTAADRAKATTTNIYDRLISYTVKTSTGRVNGVDTLTSGTDYDASLSGVEFKSATNRLGTATLSDSVVVLDATKYEAGKAETYKASSASIIVEDTHYDAILVHKSDADRKWSYVILTSAGNLYSSNSDWAVVSAKSFSTDSAKVTPDGDEVAVLKVAGADALEIAMDAEVYVSGSKLGGSTGKLEDGDHLLTEGTVFFYTTDADGYVDRIDILANVANKYDLNDTPTPDDASDDTAFENTDTADWNSIITLPGLGDYSDKVRSADWQVGMSYVGTPTFSEIQFFYAPVVSATKNSVSFAALEYVDATKKKFNTAATVDFAIAADAKIVAYDWSNRGGTDVFTDGAFYGVAQDKVGSDEIAWVYAEGATVPDGVWDFNGEVCYALVMVVDEIVTNAVIFENVD
ncbi:MAG: S-layer homology domain-containing protein [Clostridia bacterium]|nr:S-layer homology domain-containing protein [Clostridia bacterium]MBQ8637382.1 S-layer homology domain-containing protein [Clostridia bacterium]